MTATWSDNPATATTPIRAVHITKLRNEVDKIRATAHPPLPRYQWTDIPLDDTVPVKAVHFTELRRAIQEAWTNAGQGTLPNWTAPEGPPSQGRPIRASDTNDLRAWVDLYDPESIIGAHWVKLPNTRDWNHKTGWDVELVYAVNPTPGFDLNTIAGRVQQAHSAASNPPGSPSFPGRNVLLRVDYAPGQSLPPEGDEGARSQYLTFLQQVASDQRLRDNVFGYIIGNEYNMRAENGGGTPITPEWYATIFNGYGRDPADPGNAYQVLKTYHPGVAVLVGAVGPWNTDADWSPGSPVVNMPWLNYFYGACSRIYEASPARGPVDGFAIHAYGQTGANGEVGPNEPHMEVQGQGWAAGAWAGFAVYKNWRDIADLFDVGAPLFITETNTRLAYVINGQVVVRPSSYTYPAGWYVQALDEIATNGGPRFWAVCWFVDENYGSGWPDDCLTNPVGKCVDANNDFNYTLTSTPLLAVGRWL